MSHVPTLMRELDWAGMLEPFVEGLNAEFSEMRNAKCESTVYTL